MKKINAVEMVRSIRDQQSKDTLGKTPREIIAYFRDKAGKISKKTEKKNQAGVDISLNKNHVV